MTSIRKQTRNNYERHRRCMHSDSRYWQAWINRRLDDAMLAQVAAAWLASRMPGFLNKT